MQTAAAGQEPGWEALADLFGDLVRGVSPASGMFFLLPPGEPVLQIAMVYGTSWHIVAPWARIRVEEAIPAAEAVREWRLVWVGSPEQLAFHYPRLALVAPEHAVAAAPVTDGDAVRGAVCLLWPSSHPASLGREEHKQISSFCRRAGALLRSATSEGSPLLPGTRPRVVKPVRAHQPSRAEAVAAHDFASRLPGALSLDLEGRITFVSDAAADLLGARAAELLGVRPWEHLPWFGGLTFEDRFRAAVIGHRPERFTTTRALGRKLSVRLFPDPTGVSVDITPMRFAPSHDPEESTYEQTPPGPAGASTLYHLMHLAASLTETVGIQDVSSGSQTNSFPPSAPRAWF